MESREQMNTEVTFPTLQEGELPPITDEMKEIATDILGPYAEKYDPVSINAFYASSSPAFAIGLISAECYNEDPTWENAWNALVEGLRHLVYINDMRKGNT